MLNRARLEKRPPRPKGLKARCDQREKLRMSNLILLLIALFVYIAPTIVEFSTHLIIPASTFFLSENIVTIILSYFIYRGLSWKSRCAKLTTLLMLIASVLFLVNYLVIDITEADSNYVVEKANG